MHGLLQLHSISFYAGCHAGGHHVRSGLQVHLNLAVSSRTKEYWASILHIRYVVYVVNDLDVVTLLVDLQ